MTDTGAPADRKSLGVADVIAKPFDLDDLLVCLRRNLCPPGRR